MPIPAHPTALAPTAQAIAVTTDAWTSEILPQLPPDLEAHARSLKAFVRVRGLASATDLLRALLAFVLADHSTRSLGAWAVLVGLADLSESAWRQRLILAGPWLGWLLSALLAVTPVRPVPTTRRVRLIDATMLMHTGGGRASWRVHWDDDLTAGRLGSVTLTTQATGEHLDHYPLQPGDILVADGGYGYRRSVATAQRAGADVVLRIHARTFPLEDAAGQALDLRAWLRQPAPGVRVWTGWCRLAGQRYAVRLVAAPLPPEQAARAGARTARKAQRKQRRLGPDARFLAGWLLVVTTLAARDWPADELLRLYRARWQVELVFKRLKQLLRVRALRCQRTEVAEATVRALLIAWVVQEDLGAQLRQALAAEARRPVSSWQLAQLSVATLRQAVCGSWTRARLVACLGRLRRYLCGSPRRRVQQETQVRRWLNQHRGMVAPPMAS